MKFSKNLFLYFWTFSRQTINNGYDEHGNLYQKCEIYGPKVKGPGVRLGH